MMHYYQFNIGDYVKDTQHLTEMEDLAYRRMLDLYYRSESELPGSVEEIARLIRMRSHCECIALVLQEFFERTATGYANSRVEKEISAFKAKSEKAKASAKSRWSKNSNLDNANALQTQSEGNAKHKPLTINQETIITTLSSGDDEDANQEEKQGKQSKFKYDKERIKSTWNGKASGLGLPTIRSVTDTVEKGLIRLYKSYLKMCKEVGKEPNDMDTVINGYIEHGYQPTKWALGENPEGKKYGIATALTQQKIDEILGG